jgi:hypothetical protein
MWSPWQSTEAKGGELKRDQHVGTVVPQANPAPQRSLRACRIVPRVVARAMLKELLKERDEW